MKKIFAILFILLLGHFCSTAQSDSICTIKLEHFNDEGKLVTKVLNPYRGIYLKTNKGIKYSFENVGFFGDTILVIGNDTLLISNIDKVCTRGASGRYAAGAVCIFVGLLTYPIASIFLIFHGEKMDSESWNEYNQEVSNAHTEAALITLTGTGLIITGIKLMSQRRFNTKNNWIIRKGLYPKMKQKHNSN